MHWCMWWKKLLFFANSRLGILNAAVGWMSWGECGNGCWIRARDCMYASSDVDLMKYDECLIVVYWKKLLSMFFNVLEPIFKTNCWEYLFCKISPHSSSFHRCASWKFPGPETTAATEKNLINSLRKQEKAAIFNIEKFMVDGSICDDGSRMGVEGGLLQFISKFNINFFSFHLSTWRCRDKPTLKARERRTKNNFW